MTNTGDWDRAALEKRVDEPEPRFCSAYYRYTAGDAIDWRCTLPPRHRGPHGWLTSDMWGYPKPGVSAGVRWWLLLAIVVVIAVAVAIAWLATSRGVVEASPQTTTPRGAAAAVAHGQSTAVNGVVDGSEVAGSSPASMGGVLADTGDFLAPVSALRARGTASWYCGHGSACTKGYPASGLYAAAGSEIRHWRGKLVRVRSGGRSVVVRLIDACACPGRRVIDLYAVAFQRLAPLSRGVIPVTVTLERSLTVLPPTSTLEDTP